MRKIFLSKQGFLFRIISSLLQILTIIPISLLLSFFISSIVLEFIDMDTVQVFVTVFLLLNLFWLLRNSFIKVTDNKIILYDWIGKRKIIETDNINSLKIISYKELRNVIFNHSGNDPLISNCASFLFPIGNFVMFKNKFGRDVVIGVWNYKQLYNILINRIVITANCENKYTKKYEKQFISNAYNCKKYLFFINMPLKDHLVIYFKHFAETILIPLVFVLFVFFLFYRIEIKLDMIILVFMFLIVSISTYLLKLRVIVDVQKALIKLNIFNDNNKNVIKIDNICDLQYINSVKEIVNKKNNYQSVICTPYRSKNPKDLISFQISKNVCVILSIKKPNKLYDVLRNTSNRHFIE